jgi:transposase
MTMRPVKYPVRLSAEEQKELKKIITKGRSPARTIRRAQVLLAADQNRSGGTLTEREIAERLDVNTNTIYAVRKAYTTSGIEGAIIRKQRSSPPNPPKVTEEVEEKILALRQSPPPQGKKRWTLQLLAEHAVQLQYVDSISHQTVRKVLLKKRTMANKPVE